MTCSISVFGAIIVVTAVTPAIMFAIVALSLVYYQVQVRCAAFLFCAIAFIDCAAVAVTAFHAVATERLTLTPQDCRKKALVLPSTSLVLASAVFKLVTDISL